MIPAITLIRGIYLQILRSRPVFATPLRAQGRAYGFAWVFVLASLCPGPEARALEPGAQVSGIRWLQNATLEPSAGEAELLALAATPGKQLSALNDVPYQPFQPLWFVLQLERPGLDTPPEFLRFATLQRRELDAFLIVDGRVVARASGGYARTSPVQALTSPDVSLTLAAWQGTRATVLFRSVTTERLPYRTDFVSAENIREAAVARAGFLLFFAGCALVFITVQYLFHRRMMAPASRDYSLFVGISLLAHFNRAGYLSIDLCPGSGSLFLGDLQDYIKVCAMWLAMRALESYLELGTWSPALQRANRILQLSFLTAAIIAHCFGLGAFQALVSLAYAPLCMWALVVTIFAIRAKRRGSRILLVAWTGLAAAAFYVNLAILGWFPPGRYLQFIVPLGLLWEMIFNGGGLLVKLELLREERHAAQLRETEVQGLVRLVRVVCHDISNPLMVVRFALDRIRSHAQTTAAPVELTEPLRMAEQAERAIEEVIQDVRAQEQLRASGGQLRSSAIDLPALAREALGLFHVRAVEKKIEVRDQLPAHARALGVPGIVARNVIANVIANAVKFTPKGGSIILRLESASDRLGLRVCDEGPGIPAETVAALEQAAPLFSRLGSDGERGSGFGLQIAHEFVEAMGGSMTFAVPAPETGRGTAVTIWLRRASD